MGRPAIVVGIAVLNLGLFSWATFIRYGWRNMVNPPLWGDQSVIEALISVHSFGLKGFLAGCIITFVLALCWKLADRSADVFWT